MATHGTETRICSTCGEGYEHPVGGPGKPPKHCPSHRKKRGVPADPEAYRDRKEQRRRRLRRDEKALDSELREKHLAAAKLARRLGRMKNPRHAADALGLRCSDEELGELVELAERDFKGLIEGDAAAVAELLNDVVVDLVCSVASRHNEVAPALLGNTVRALAQVRESYVGQGGSNDWTDVTVVFMPPDDGDPPVAA